MDDLNALATFVSVAEHGSFTKAANAARVPKSKVSRQVARLEKALNSPLLHRSTRAVSLTDAGQKLCDRARRALVDVRDAMAEARGNQAGVVGTVRISATAAFGQRILAPILCDLMQNEPDLRIDLQFNENRVDVVQTGIDLAIRMGSLSDSDLRARRLCLVPRLLCASQSYLDRRKSPNGPADLADHDCIVTAPTLTRWTFADGSNVVVKWRFSAGSVAMAREAALGGQGIAILPYFIVETDLAEKKLIPVLSEHPLPDAEVTAIYPNDRIPATATSAVLAHLIRALARKRL